MALGGLLHPRKGYPGQHPRREQQPGIAQFLTHSVDVQYRMVGFLLHPNLCVPVNLALVILLTAGSETKQSVTCYGLFPDLWVNLRVHIPRSGHENRPPHLYARSNRQLKEEEDMGFPTEEQTLPGQEISDNYSCHN